MMMLMMMMMMMMMTNEIIDNLPYEKYKSLTLIYDNACAAEKSSLRRFPHRVRKWTFICDRTHWKNHTSCRKGYNMDLYPMLKGVNSQQAEQINRSLRSLSVVLAFSSFEHYMKILAYLIFVISFTQAGFSKTKFYTQKNDKRHQKH